MKTFLITIAFFAYTAYAGAVSPPPKNYLPAELRNEEVRCDNGQPYGCYKGYCWKACGDIVKGQWCWTAKQPEKTKPVKCETWLDCGDEFRTFGCVKDTTCGCL